MIDHLANEIASTLLANFVIKPFTGQPVSSFLEAELDNELQMQNT